MERGRGRAPLDNTMERLMKRAIIFCLLPAVLLLLGGHPLMAQRTSVGESALSLSGGTTLSGWGGEAAYGRYLLGGFWMGSLAFHDRRERDIPSGEAVRFPRLELRGGYMQRLLGSYSRALSLYAGGDGFIGLEMLDLFRTLTPPTLSALRGGGLKDITFIWGAAPRVELEWFPFRSAALILGARMPFTFGSPFPVIGGEISIGLKVNFQ